MQLPEQYHQDSLFTLGTGGIAGVLAIAAVLTGLALLTTRLVARRRHWTIRMIIAVFVFGLFEWLSPQIFYEFYRMIIDGLPRQWVIRPPTPQGLIELVSFRAPASLSSHGRGGLFWLLLIVALFSGHRLRRNAAN